MKTAVFCHIYYADLVDECMEYLCHVPPEYDIYISYFIEETGRVLREYIQKNNLPNVVLKYKPNRGRDVSALLVTFREDILKYDVFCFIHDKKSLNNIRREESAVKWRNTYFEALLDSQEYVEKTVGRFQSNGMLGILTVPVPFEGEYIYGFGDEWLIAYEAAQELAQKIGMKTFPQREEDTETVMIGTAFWARTKALGKLLAYPFAYEDFPDEPMKTDGQLGHAVERMIGFIAKDAGYTMETVQTERLLADRADKMEKLCRRLLFQMRKLTLLKEEEYVDTWADYVVELFRFCHSYERIFIYGTSFFAEKALGILKNIGVKCEGMIVSDGYKTEDVFKGYQVYELSEFGKMSAHAGIIIAVYDVHGFRAEIIGNLRKINFSDYMVLH